MTIEAYGQATQSFHALDLAVSQDSEALCGDNALHAGRNLTDLLDSGLSGDEINELFSTRPDTEIKAWLRYQHLCGGQHAQANQSRTFDELCQVPLSAQNVLKIYAAASHDDGQALLAAVDRSNFGAEHKAAIHVAARLTDLDAAQYDAQGRYRAPELASGPHREFYQILTELSALQPGNDRTQVRKLLEVMQILPAGPGWSVLNRLRDLQPLARQGLVRGEELAGFALSDANFRSIFNGDSIDARIGASALPLAERLKFTEALAKTPAESWSGPALQRDETLADWLRDQLGHVPLAEQKAHLKAAATHLAPTDFAITRYFLGNGKSLPLPLDFEVNHQPAGGLKNGEFPKLADPASTLLQMYKQTPHSRADVTAASTTCPPTRPQPAADPLNDCKGSPVNVARQHERGQ